MCVNRRITGILLFITIALTLLTLAGFYQNLLANGNTYISSPLDTHLTQDTVKANKGRIVDRDNLEWPADPANAVEMLKHWEDADAASNAMDSVYHLLYNGNNGIALLESNELLGLHDAVFNAESGVGDLYNKKGHDVYITVSGAFNEKLYTALKDSGAVNGEAILTNYKTGEILAWTSLPPASDLFYSLPGSQTIKTVQPYQLSVLISITANNGKACRPYIVSRVVSRESGETIDGINYDIPGYLNSPFLGSAQSDPQIARALMEKECRENGRAADLGAVMKKLGYTAAAQTGAADILHNDEGPDGNGNNAKVSWIACFLEEKPFVLVAAVQGGDAGAAVKIAGDMLPLAVNMNLDSPQFAN